MVGSALAFCGISPLNDAVGEPGGLNRYSYVNGNPVNLVDPSGMCAQPTQWWNPIDANCFYSADGLARRFSNDDPSAYQAWFDVLIQKSWGELKVLEGLDSWTDFGNTDIAGFVRYVAERASIIPRLFIENPRAALEVLNRIFCGQGTSQLALGAVAAPGTSGIPSVPPVIIIGGLVFITIAGTLVLLSEYEKSKPIPYNPPAPTQKTCNFEQCSELESRIRGNVYNSVDGALNALKSISGNNSLAKSPKGNEGDPLSNDGPVCPGIGFHWNTRPFEGSIVCCPCCNGNNEARRCFIVR